MQKKTDLHTHDSQFQQTVVVAAQLTLILHPLAAALICERVGTRRVSYLMVYTIHE